MSGNSNPRDPLEVFTKPGRLLVILSTLFGAAVCYFAIANDLFAPGFHPVFIFLLPGFAGAVTLFCIGCVVYRLLGIRVWKTSNADRSAAAEEARPKDGESKAPADDQNS
jgi:hypothetical protein